MRISPSARAVSQYSTTSANLTARMALHVYGTNPQDWFSWLAERLPTDGGLLEVGAGTGELWRRVGAGDRRLTLTDFSPAMCALLRTVPGAAVRRCDAAALPFAGGVFDAVVANHMLYHLDDPDVAIREFRRVLRPGGRLVVALNGREHMQDLAEIGRAIGRPELRPAAFTNGVDAETGPARIAACFDGVAVERYPGDLLVPVAEPILAALRSIEVAPLTPREWAAARDFVQARIDERGGYRIRKHTVLISAGTP